MSAESAQKLKLLLQSSRIDYHIEESGLPTSVVQHPDDVQQTLVVGHIWIIDLLHKRANI